MPSKQDLTFIIDGLMANETRLLQSLQRLIHGEGEGGKDRMKSAEGAGAAAAAGAPKKAP